MSVLSIPVVSDVVAHALSAVSSLAPKPRRAFSDLPVKTSTAVVPTQYGAVKCTIYWPNGDIGARPPVYVNLHGGGFIIRYPEQDDPWCRYLATNANVVVVNPDYGTAPRHRFPAPVYQAYEVVTWVAAAERDWDGGRLCVGGQSAGGSLTAGVARLALERGGPEIALQVLHYPVLDMVTKDKPAPAGKKVPSTWMGEVFHTSYLPDPAQRSHYLASPMWGTNADGIKNIAPALVITAERDQLRAEGAAYAGKLDAVGSLVEHRDLGGVGHGYDILGESAETTRRTYEFVAAHVRRATDKT